MRVLPLLAACCLLLASCGEAKISGDDVERFIRTKLRNPEAVTAVVCPSERPAKKGDRFECTIDLKDGSQEKATIEQTDDDGHVALVANLQSRLATGTVTLKRANLEALIATQLPDVKADTAKCPDDEPIKFGRVTRCTVLSAKDGETYVVSILQFDKLGNVRITGVQPRK
jgi:Domain of unknown function (DUF4333)